VSETTFQRTALAAFALGIALAATSGCASEERLSPVDRPSSSNSSGGGAEPEPEPAVRQVFVRNPIGLPIDNLLADGDFELSIVPEGEAGGQYGWIALRGNGGTAPLLAETGGLCRSGLRCGRLPAGRILFGRGTAAPYELPHKASIWVKAASWKPRPPAELAEPCKSLADVYVLACDSFSVLATLRPAELPSADGWCELRAEVAGSKRALCVYAEIGSEEVLLDHATLLAAPELENGPLPAPITPPKPTTERMSLVREQLRARMPLGPAKPVVTAKPKGLEAREGGLVD
jgi:hypothetical protein